MDPAKKAEYSNLLLSLIPDSGESVGNVTLGDGVKAAVAQQQDDVVDQDYWLLRDSVIDDGAIFQWHGRGGSVCRVVQPTPLEPAMVAAPTTAPRQEAT